MRWSIIRLIWLRELRDQLRDRRTLFMIAVLPLLLYPVLGFAVLQFALGFAERPNVIGIVHGPNGQENFPERHPDGAGLHAVPLASWLSLAPLTGSRPDQLAGAAALAQGGRLFLDYPLLVRNGRFTTFDSRFSHEQARLLIAQARLRIVFLNDAEAAAALEDKRVDLVLSASADFFRLLERDDMGEPGPPPEVRVLRRPDDDYSRQAWQRLVPVLESWKRDLKKVRLARKDLPLNFDEPFAVHDPASQQPGRAPGALFDLFVRVFPFMLVMWSLAGALYPAVDLCAGEKERGTMETLLISPARREEIVVGKFLAIWVFSAASALLNLASMGLTTWQFGSQLPQGAVTFGALFWCLLLSLPLTALFSAICLAIGAYARSSKEGQYYLMPLFFVTLPLVLLTLAPGVELSPFYSLVPVSGVALLMQRLMTAPSLDQLPWLYFVPVLAPIALYSWLALRWAIEQFHREEVLFREAERLDLRLWFQRLFREKEATPTAGQALFCFALIVGLRWLSLSFGQDLPALVHTGISLIAFVATPALLMALMLNTRPRDGLLLLPPKAREVGVAAALALLLLPPLAALAQAVFTSYPNLTKLLEDRQPLVQELRFLGEGQHFSPDSFLPFLLVFGLLAAVCEEVAFRGFILSGLLKRFRPRTAILFSSFLFALFHMNVFQFLPSFILGVVLGLLTVRSKSLVPAIMFHLLHNTLLIGGMFLFRWALSERSLDLLNVTWPTVIGVCLVVGLGVLWWLYRKPYVDLARKLALEEQAQLK